MATLKELSMRLKAVTNIQKITKSMKMVSAAKYARAEKELKPARPYGKSARVFYECAEVEQDDKQPNHLIVAMTSDRGLCGGTHTNIARAIKADVPQKAANTTTKIICVGDKSRAILGRIFKDNMLMHFVDIGKRPPSFEDASIVANEILNSGFEYDHAQLYFNVFRTVVAYDTTVMPLYSMNQVSEGKKINVYDSLDEDVVRNYTEYSLTSLIYYAMKECACTEQSQRMTAMEGATKNAGEMIDKLRLTYNRTRQAVITRELIEIISGAAALK